MLDLLDYEFMRLALAAAVITGLTAPAIGVFLVQRRLALLGDGIGHVALTGVAVGLLTGTAPILTAVVAAVAGAVVIEVMRAYARTSGDVALAMLFYGGIAGGVMIVNLAGESAAKLNSYLFGSIVTVTPADLRIIALLGGVVLLLTLTAAPQLFAVCQDPDHAQVSGVPVRLYSLLVAVLAAVTITVAMRTVGLLLVSALMIVPVAAAQQLTRSFRGTHLAAMAIGLFAAVGGVGLSFEVDTQPGPTIVMTALACFVVLALARGVVALTARGKTRRLESA
ncbi:MAG: metal ABC transporter permease [Aeromicrobium sp.]|uniref:metal ABC transporter permease n=1 Tax=Aeromicrobium sp. TaxID=1871063 RepID=UPI0039E49738